MTTEAIGRPKTAVERAIALRKVEAFRRVSMEQLAYVAAVAKEDFCPAGSTLFREGGPPGSLIVILDGRIRLERNGRSIGDVAAGEALGTWSLFDEHPRQATAIAVEDSRVLCLDRDDFYEVLSEHMEITRGLVQGLVRRLLELTGMAGEEKR